MSNRVLYLGIGAMILILVLGGYLLLSRKTSTPQDQYQTVPLTPQNADSTLSQTESNIEVQLDQADQDLKAAEETDTTSQYDEDLSSINSL